MATFLGALLERSGESTLSERFGNYWLLLGAVFVVVVVFFPLGVFGRLFKPQLPARLRVGGPNGPEHRSTASLSEGVKILKIQH